MAEVRAIAKYVRVPPRKARRVAALIRGENAVAALERMRFVNTRAARHVAKVLKSAIANAETNAKLDRASLVVRQARVDDGTVGGEGVGGGTGGGGHDQAVSGEAPERSAVDGHPQRGGPPREAALVDHDVVQGKELHIGSLGPTCGGPQEAPHAGRLLVAGSERDSCPRRGRN